MARTKKMIEDENFKLRDRLEDSRFALKKEEEWGAKQIQRLRDKDGDRRFALSAILSVDDHASESQSKVMDAGRTLSNFTDFSHKRRAFSWDEIFFMIGGLHSTSEYALKCREIAALRSEIEQLKEGKDE